MSKLYSGAEIVFKCLEDQNVEFIFGYPGGAVLPIYDELKNFNSVKHILVRHEQGAGHAAEGYARSSGKPGVLLVTSGPGATNAVTALTDAYMDSVPLVCISGQVPTHLIGTDAFQECDTTGITRPCTKHNWLVKDVKDLEKTIHKAFEVATTGRPGPVLVDIPKDVQFQKTNYTKFKKQKTLNGKVNSQFTQKDIDELIKLMSKASKPIFYTGGGVINSGPKASELLRELVNTTGFPITSTLQGLGSYPGEDSQFLGMLGMHGSYEANNAMHDCDLMINIGARFDDRITGKIDEFSPKSKKVHIDIDPSSINKNVKVDLPIVGDVTYPDSTELKQRIYDTFPTQNRAVTQADYENVAYRMPVQYGSIKRCLVSKDQNSLKRNLNMYVISEDQFGKLTKTNSTIKNNLKTWLNQFRMINDTVDILDPFIVNIGIEFVVRPTTSTDKFALLNRCIKALTDKYQTSFFIGEPFYISDVYSELKKVTGVLDVEKVKVVNKAGGNYASAQLNINKNMSPDGSYLVTPYNAILEIKFPSMDIKGKVR